MTFEQAKQLQIGDELHTNGCRYETGPRGGKTYHVVRIRVNGRVKTWKRNPTRIRIPYKYGLYDYGYVTENTLFRFHLVSECPIYRS